MLVFLAIVVFLLVIVLTFMVVPLFRPNTALRAESGVEKREIFRQQFDEIEQDKMNGMLDIEQYDNAKVELERRMLDELGASNVAATNVKPDRLLAFILIILLPILSIYIYLVIGRPIAIIMPLAAPINVSENASISALTASSASLNGTITIAPALASKLDPDTTVFVFARAVQGSPMPLAITRITAKDLPYTYQLDDSNALMPGLMLSQASEVVLVAQVSISGDAKPQAGDFLGLSAPVKPDGAKVDVEINQLVP